MTPRTLFYCLMGVTLLALGLFHVALERNLNTGMKPVISPSGFHQFSDSEQELLTKFLNISLETKDDRLNDVTSQINQTLADVVQQHNPLVQLYPELHERIPKTFNSHFKSPCWFHDGKLKCLPYFYLIGMPKCGTTDLWDKLVQHPQVQSVPKEPHWWSKRRNGWTKTPVHSVQVHRIRHMTRGKDDSSVDWYLNWFEVFAIPTVKSKPKTIFGDGSVTTAFTSLGHWKSDFPGFKEPPYSLPDLMHSVQPSAKIIAIVRDPVSRFYSAHLYTGGRNNKSFRIAAVRSVECMEKCLRHHTDRRCAYQQVCDTALINVSYINNTNGYFICPLIQIFRGMYVIFLADWIKAFGHEQVHVILLDDWIKDPIQAYKDLINFLEIDNITNSAIKSIFNQSIKNSQSRKKKRAGDMLLSSKRLLQAFYRPYNRQLAALLNDSKYLWDYG